MDELQGVNLSRVGLGGLTGLGLGGEFGGVGDGDGGYEDDVDLESEDLPDEVQAGGSGSWNEEKDDELEEYGGDEQGYGDEGTEGERMGMDMELELDEQADIEEEEEEVGGDSSPISSRPLRTYRRVIKPPKPGPSLSTLFPDFAPGKILNFTDLFAPRELRKSWLRDWDNPDDVWGDGYEVLGEDEEVEDGEEIVEEGRQRKRRKVAVESANPHLLSAISLPSLSPSTTELLSGTEPPRIRPDRKGKGREQPGVLDLRVSGKGGNRGGWGEDGRGDVRTEEEVLRETVSRLRRRHGINFRIPPSQDDSGSKHKRAMLTGMEMESWENQIIWDRRSQRLDDSTSNKNHLPFSNPLVDTVPWEASIIWDSRTPYRPFDQLEVNLNDAALQSHLEILSPGQQQTRPGGPKSGGATRDQEKSFPGGGGFGTTGIGGFQARNENDPFNLSNDKIYDTRLDLVGRGKRIRQTFGNLDVTHSWVAEKLQFPFYKTRLTKTDCRSFHRPTIQFPLNLPITFSKVRSAKKNKNKRTRFGGPNGNQHTDVRTTHDLSIKDTSGYCLLEYCEEYPPIMSNTGMGSMIVNYYRKKDAKDETIPQSDIGEPFILDVNDESPFMKFGSVHPGEIRPTFYNNMVRAPLFKQKPYETDFLVVRSTINGDSKYYIRAIPHLFVVGQNLPVQEVPGPNSRKITSGMKDRLKTVTFKLLRKSKANRVKITKLMKYFPDQNELQMRQKLKDFMEYHRKGANQGSWMLRDGVTIPDNSELLKLPGNSPEFVCLAESMQAGQRHLMDCGFGGDDEDDGKEDNDKLEVEQQLAPWITTKNFLLAHQGKAMLKLYGEGDPSGRGEGFSFQRVSMKDNFVKPGEEEDAKPRKYNVAQQQEIYRSEIERIWRLQAQSLSNPREPIVTEEDERRFRAAPTGVRRGTSLDIEGVWGRHGPGGIKGRGPSRSPSVSFSPSSPVAERDDASAAGRAGNKVLKVRRLVEGKWNTETIRDPHVISAYMKERRMIEEENTIAESLMPSDDQEKNKLMKKRIEEQLVKLRRNQERRLQRKKTLGGDEGGSSGRKPKESQRKCGNCGQIGHMKTNRKCPLWAKFNAPGGEAGSPPASAGLVASPFTTMHGLPMGSPPQM